MYFNFRQKGLITGVGLFSPKLIHKRKHVACRSRYRHQYVVIALATALPNPGGYYLIKAQTQYKSDFVRGCEFGMWTWIGNTIKS